jgi:hypothetical protein
MSNYRSRPKGNYIQDTNLQDLYLLAETWNQDIEFYTFEIEFLDRLIDTYFVKLLLHENLDELRVLQKDLFKARTQCKQILQRINVQLNYIVDILDEPFKYNITDFRNDYEQLEDDIEECREVLKGLRYAVFNTTKVVLESEKPKFIWKYN